MGLYFEKANPIKDQSPRDTMRAAWAFYAVAKYYRDNDGAWYCVCVYGSMMVLGAGLSKRDAMLDFVSRYLKHDRATKYCLDYIEHQPGYSLIT